MAARLATCDEHDHRFHEERFQQAIVIFAISDVKDASSKFPSEKYVADIGRPIAYVEATDVPSAYALR